MRAGTVQRKQKLAIGKYGQDIRKVFARNLRRLMVERGYDKQWALAIAADIKPSAVSEYLRGQKTPHLDTLQRIAETLGVEPIDLLTR